MSFNKNLLEIFRTWALHISLYFPRDYIFDCSLTVSTRPTVPMPDGYTLLVAQLSYMGKSTKYYNLNQKAVQRFEQHLRAGHSNSPPSAFVTLFETLPLTFSKHLIIKNKHIDSLRATCQYLALRINRCPRVSLNDFMGILTHMLA